VAEGNQLAAPLGGHDAGDAGGVENFTSELCFIGDRAKGWTRPM